MDTRSPAQVWDSVAQPGPAQHIWRGTAGHGAVHVAHISQYMSHGMVTPNSVTPMVPPSTVKRPLPLAQPTTAQCHRPGYSGPSTCGTPSMVTELCCGSPWCLQPIPASPPWGSPPPSPFSPNPLLPYPSPPNGIPWKQRTERSGQNDRSCPAPGPVPREGKHPAGPGDTPKTPIRYGQC